MEQSTSPHSREALDAVNWTGVRVARVRAAETARQDRLFDDPLAAQLAAAFGEPPDAAAPGDNGSSPVRRMLRDQVIIRTRFYDDYLIEATRAGCTQVGLLGAGLDTRAYRLPWPHRTRLFELDVGAVLTRKDEILSQATMPRCERITVPIDLRADWPAALRASGFRPAEQTAWLAEGLLIYLDADEADGLLTSVDLLSVAGSRLATETARGAMPQADGGVPLRPSDVRRLWRGGLGEDLGGWLQKRGWSSQVDPVDDVAAGYGRALEQPVPSGFVTAVKN
jgi:methyltransferase (TIGR00027 family)